MLDSLFATQTATTELALMPFLASMGCAIALGFVLALAYCFKAHHTKSFVVALAMLPAIVCVVIAMVNGNIGAGVAVAGTFGLVRFRSAPGTARDITFIFLAMCVGLVTGMGYVGWAVIVTAIMCAVILAYQLIEAGPLGESSDRLLRITVPEDLDFTNMFDDVLRTYTTYFELESVRTTNMGSLYRLIYRIGMRDLSKQRDLIDELRCRNGNLEIVIAHQEVRNGEL